MKKPAAFIVLTMAYLAAIPLALAFVLSAWTAEASFRLFSAADRLHDRCDAALAHLTDIAIKAREAWQ